MTAAAFRFWMERTGLNGRQAAEVLGRSRDTISSYRYVGVPERESRMVSLACAAYAHGLPGWASERPKG